MSGDRTCPAGEHEIPGCGTGPAGRLRFAAAEIAALIGQLVARRRNARRG